MAQKKEKKDDPKANYQQAKQTQLEKHTESVQKLKVKAEKSVQKGKDKVQKELGKIEKRITQAEENLQGFLGAGEEAWNTLRKKLEALGKKAEQQVTESSSAIHKEVATLDQKIADAEKALKSLVNAGEGAWEEIKSGVEGAWTDLSNSIKNAAAKFK